MKLRFFVLPSITVLGLSLLNLGQDRPVAASVDRGACTPVNFQETSRKIFRQNRMYFEGLADLTGDGRPDAYGFELQADNSYQNIVILPNDNAGGFGDPIIVNTTLPIEISFEASLTVMDLNGDGRKDFVVKSATAPRAILTLQSNGGGSYTQSPTTPLGNESLAAIADINADGRGDIVTQSGGGVYFRLGNPDGTFGAAVLAYPEDSVATVVVGNFSGDEKPDIAFNFYESPLYQYQLLTNLGGGVFSPSAPVTAEMDTLWGAADLNGDGLLDIYGRNRLFYIYGLSELLNNGNGTFTKVDLPQVPLPDFGANFLTGHSTTFLADVNGDGHKDLIESVQGRTGGDNIVKRFANIYTNDGTATFTKTILREPFLGLPADMNGDGKDEQIVFVNSNAGERRFNAANETVVIVRSALCVEPPRTPRTQLIDFGGDGISDIVIWRPGNGRWQWASNLIGGTFPWGVSADLPAPGDFDGDGKTDASVFRPGDGTWYVYKSATSTVTATQFGLAGDLPVAGDYNGDGKSDIGVFRPSDGNWYISFTDIQQYSFVHWGLSGDRPVPNDYDGDGRIDLAVFRPSEGNWYYVRSSDQGIGAYNWGVETDLPIPADYDMDGRADLCVYRPGNGVWYILRSVDGTVTASYFGQIFGEKGEVPMVVDSDGDGIMEQAVYRQFEPFGSWRATAQEFSHWGTFGAGPPVRLFQQNN